MTSHAKARWLLVTAAVLFSTGGAAIKTGAFDAMQVSAARSGLAALTLLVTSGGQVQLSWPVGGAALIYASTLTLSVLATKLTTGANATFLQSAAPLYLILLGPWLLREHVRRRDVLFASIIGAGLAACFFGRVDAGATAPDPETGNILGLASSMTWAATLAALRLVSRDDQKGRAATSVVIIGNAIASIGALLFAGPYPSAPLLDWLDVAFLGIVQIGLAYTCLTRAIGHLPALDASLLLLIEPVLNPFWTWLIRGEQPGVWTLVGGACILITSAAKAWLDSATPVPAPIATP